MNRRNFFGFMGKAAISAVATGAAIKSSHASVVYDEELAAIIRDMRSEPDSREPFGMTVRRVILEGAGLLPV